MQNILFGEDFERKRYEETIENCALDYDLSRLEHGDETLVADRGQNLSKGQQARINLARAIYKNSDIYIFDDSLTSLDETVQDFIFNKAILRLVKDKLVIMVSQNPKHIERADSMIIMDRGAVLSKIEQTCTLKELILKSEGVPPQDMKITEDLKTATVINGSTCNNVEKRIVYDEFRKQGKVDLNIYKKYINFGGGFYLFSLIIILYTAAQYFISYSDKLLTSW